ncbi:PREDICTED: protein FAR1-RELATED SEQUENCE 5-like [Ipomoea nil]|uniref:protein FAR1-RELATED SEQUENCE 5-like n=1 Tax=Ipomoea nil TaxID=35883 RepID=UPI000901FA50|nr:PREDICTED: protein FAR1-RELATED SEQUENCE 5-like [Ipomoea nil]
MDSKSFEDAWSCIMEEYGLGDNGWFRYLFDSRTFWASPYFHDEFMSGLVRTTSRSESKNSFFGTFCNGHSSLVEFLVHFGSAIGAQRHAQAKLNADCESCFPVLKTPLALEKHAMDVYTIFVFYDVQVEIYATCYSCQVASLCDCDGHVSYGIKDGAQRAWYVELVLPDYTATCSCKMFKRMGLLCTHIFFKDRGLESIPSRYFVSRWTKGACLKPIFHIDDTIVDESSKVENLRRVLCEQRQLFLQDGSENSSGVVAGGSKQSVINSFCGAVSQGSIVEVRDPIQANNKGNGKWLKSTREKTASKCMCKAIKEMSYL